MKHKPGCLLSASHRVPIDCVTAQMPGAIDTLKSEKAVLEADIVRLKARIFDLQEEQ